MTYSLASFELGTIKRERVSCDSQLFEQPMPASSAADTVLIDLFGVRKEIVLEGTFVTGTGGKTIKQFIDQFIDDTTGVIRGNQSSLSYTSDTFTNALTSKVMVSSFNYTYDEGDVSKVSYTLTLIEGGL